jgi:C4-dicarboxylate transporter
MKVIFKDLLLIILGVASCYAYFYWQEYKDKKEIKKQERLNRIK